MSSKNTVLSAAALDAANALIDVYINCAAGVSLDCLADDHDALKALVGACKALADAECDALALTIESAFPSEDVR